MIERKHHFKSIALRFLMLIAFLFVTQLSFAQKTISGIVKDTNGEPIIGANIFAKESVSGTIADIEGNFSFNITDKDKTLQVSYVGYKSQTIPIGAQTKFTIILQEDAQVLSDVVVIGYGVQKKTTVTGSISTIKGDELAAIPVANISQSMAGKVAGISMRPNGGQPGFDSPDIHVRGIVTTGNKDRKSVV